jgi:hypothetical protein
MKKVIHHIKKIREQPEHVRRTILYITIGFFAVILFLLWIYSLGTAMTGEEAKIKIDQNIKPFSVIKDNITNQYNNISNPDSSMDSGVTDGEMQQ